jgi:hypothetical protein
MVLDSVEENVKMLRGRYNQTPQDTIAGVRSRA